jgi:hypothetical protein
LQVLLHPYSDVAVFLQVMLLQFLAVLFTVSPDHCLLLLVLLLLLLLPLAVKIGRPGYRVTKQYDLETRQRSLLFQVRLGVRFSP